MTRFSIYLNKHKNLFIIKDLVYSVDKKTKVRVHAGLHLCVNAALFQD